MLNKNCKLFLTSSLDESEFLIRKLNKLYSDIQNNDFTKEIGELLGELFEYTEYHFEIEEEIFGRYNYLEKESHMKEHENFKNYIKSHLSEKGNYDLIMATNIIIYLKTWIVHHIKEIDVPYMLLLIKNSYVN